MRFKTAKNSETGLKIMRMDRKIDVCNERARQLSENVHASSFMPNLSVAYGGIRTFLFEDGLNPDKKTWDRKLAGFWPSKRTREGRYHNLKLLSLPTITKGEMNTLVSYHNTTNNRCIGLVRSNPDYYLYSLGRGWKYTPPDDCEEINEEEYQKLKKDGEEYQASDKSYY